MVRDTLYIPIDNARNPYEKIFIIFYNEIFIDLTVDMIESYLETYTAEDPFTPMHPEYKKKRYIVLEHFKKIVVSEYLIAQKITTSEDVLNTIETLAKIKYIVHNYLNDDESYVFLNYAPDIFQWIGKRALYWSEQSIKFYEIQLEGNKPEEIMREQYVKHYRDTNYLEEMYRPYTEDLERFFQLIRNDEIYDYVTDRLEEELRYRDINSPLRIRIIENDTLYEVIIF